LVVSEEQDQANIHIKIWSFAHQDLRINNSCGVLVVARERALGRIWGYGFVIELFGCNLPIFLVKLS